MGLRNEKTGKNGPLLPPAQQIGPKSDRLLAWSLRADGGRLSLSDFEAPLARHFGLRDDEVQTKYESGNGRVFYDRISWALSSMNMAGLLIKPARGVYEISELGRKILQ